jgi:hypothetical protein
MAGIKTARSSPVSMVRGSEKPVYFRLLVPGESMTAALLVFGVSGF